MFQKLDKSKLPNISNMWDVVLQRTAKYDPGNEYSVNYMWGTVGLGYNTKKVTEALGIEKIDSWDIFFDPDKLAKLADCGVYVLDSPSDILPTAMKYLGLDPGEQIAGRFRQGGRGADEDPAHTSASSIRRNTSMRWPMATSASRSAGRATCSRRATAPPRPTRA